MHVILEVKCEVVRRVWWDGSPECGVALLVEGFDIESHRGLCMLCWDTGTGRGRGAEPEGDGFGRGRWWWQNLGKEMQA